MPRDVLIQDFGSDAVDLTIRQGNRSGRIQRAAVGSGEAAVSLFANRTSGTGPAGFIFGATATGFATDRAFQELRYKWTFGDPGSLFTRLASNMPWGQGANVAYGPYAAHTYAPTAADFLAAGSDTIHYTVTCEVTDGTSTVTETIQVSVVDPDVVFSGLGTILVDPGNDFSLGLAMYPGAQTFTDILAAEAAIGNGDLARVLLRGDNSYASPSNWRCEHLHLGSFGESGQAYPIFDAGGVEVDPSHGGDVELVGLSLHGGYDPTVPTSSSGIVDGIYIRGKKKTGYHTTIHDVGIRGHKVSIKFEGQRMNNVVSDCRASDWYDFGAYQGNCGWTALIGTTLQQNAETINGPGKYASDPANHGPARFSRVIDGSPLLFNNCDLASFNDWSISASKYSVQPPLRANNGGDFNLPKLVLTQLRAIGAQLGLPATNPYSDSPGVEAIFDKIYHVKWGQGGRHLGSSFGGVRFTNVVTIESDTDWAGGGVFNCGPGGYEGGGDNPTRYPVYLGYPNDDGVIEFPQEYLGITVVKLASATNVDVASQPIDLYEFGENQQYYPDGGPYSRNPESVSSGGVLVYAPTWGLSPSLKTDDPLSEYPVLPVGTNREGQARDTAYAMSLSDLASYAPLSRVDAPEGDVLPLDDFYGVLREGDRQSGAILLPA